MKNLTIKYLLLAGAILGPVANVSAMDKLQSDVTEIKSMVTRILSYHEKEATAPEATAGGGGGGGGGVAASAVPPDPIDMHKKIRLLISRASSDERLYPAVLAAIAQAKANNFDLQDQGDNKFILTKIVTDFSK